MAQTLAESQRTDQKGAHADRAERNALHARKAALTQRGTQVGAPGGALTASKGACSSSNVAEDVVPAGRTHASGRRRTRPPMRISRRSV